MKNFVQRYKYLSENFSKGCGIPGACGDDVCIMAYDAVVRAGESFEKMLVYSALHPGDSDTVACIAFGWYGAYYSNQKIYLIVENMLKRVENYASIRQLFFDPIVDANLMIAFYRNYYCYIARRYFYEKGYRKIVFVNPKLILNQ